MSGKQREGLEGEGREGDGREGERERRKEREVQRYEGGREKCGKSTPCFITTVLLPL